MSSTKTISRMQIFWLVVVFQQSGVFWLLPYFLVRVDGTAGLLAMWAGMLTATGIIATSQYWYHRMPDRGLVPALQYKHKLCGTVTGILFLLFYLFFAMVMLYSFVDVTQQQLLEETPVMVLCAVTVLLVGRVSQNGLESIARLTVLCVGALVLMLVVSVAGTTELFAIENALPVRINSRSQMLRAAMHSIFCYSGFLVLFMLYPAGGKNDALNKTIWCAMGVGIFCTAAWTFYALCILGQYSLQSILWIPVHLARMVQISSLLEQTESLFVVLWMMLSVSAGSLFLWCASECLHQLFQKQTTWWLHWGAVLTVLIGMVAINNSMRLLQLEALLARLILILLPAILLLVVWLTPKSRR